MNLIALFFAGAFICNCIPHLACGLQGAPFPTPFASPRGIGHSSPLVNFLWGFANFLAGAFLLSRHRIAFEFDPSLTTLSLMAPYVGALAMGAYLSLHFGKVQREQKDE